MLVINTKISWEQIGSLDSNNVEIIWLLTY